VFTQTSFAVVRAPFLRECGPAITIALENYHVRSDPHHGCPTLDGLRGVRHAPPAKIGRGRRLMHSPMSLLTLPECHSHVDSESPRLLETTFTTRHATCSAVPCQPIVCRYQRAAVTCSRSSSWNTDRPPVAVLTTGTTTLDHHAHEPS
jgi:hypothetical protein